MSATRTGICGSGEKFYVDERSNNDTDSDSSGGDVSSSWRVWEGDEPGDDNDDIDASSDQSGGNLSSSDCREEDGTDWPGPGRDENEEQKEMDWVEEVWGDGLRRGGEDVILTAKSEPDMAEETAQGEKAPDTDMISSNRPKRGTVNPEPAYVTPEYKEDELPSSNGQDMLKKKEIEKRQREYRRKKAERDEENDSEYDVAVGNLENKKRKLGDHNNGKLIKPPLPGSEHLASGYSFVYLMRSESNHWYIGHSQQPWIRIREHNGELRGVAGSNLGEHTRDPNKRPWKQLFLIEGFESRMAAQGLESQWQAKHPDLQNDQTSDVADFITTLNKLLHEKPWHRVLLDIRLFDAKSAEDWKKEASQRQYKQATLRFIDNIHEDIPGWGGDITSSNFKNHVLENLRQQMRGYGPHREHFLRGRKIITESDATHTCTICSQTIGENDGKGKPVFQNGFVAPTPLTVLCPAAECGAVSHMTCLANEFFKNEKRSGRKSDYREVTLPVPISGTCNICNARGDWKDYRREIQWRLKASQKLWRELWERQAQDNKTKKRYEREIKVAKKKGQAPPTLPSELAPQRDYGPRPAVLVDGSRPQVQHQDWDERQRQRLTSAAIQKMVFKQIATGDIRKLTWFEKILLGDTMCLDRFHEWLVSHLDNQVIIRTLKIQDKVNRWRIVMADVARFFDASSVSWANYECSRKLPRFQAKSSNNRLRATQPGKRIFEDNDTKWMFDDDEETREILGIPLSGGDLRRKQPTIAYQRKIREFYKEDQRRKRRVAHDKFLQPTYKDTRTIENNTEYKRQRELKSSKKELKRLCRIRADQNPNQPADISLLILKQQRIIARLDAKDERRQRIMAERKRLAEYRRIVRKTDHEHVIEGRKIRRVQILRRRYILASAAGVQSTARHSLVQRRMPKTRVRIKLPRVGKDIGLDSTNKLSERTRSGDFIGSSSPSPPDVHKDAAFCMETHVAPDLSIAVSPKPIHDGAITNFPKQSQPAHLTEEMDINMSNLVEPDSLSSTASPGGIGGQDIFSSQGQIEPDSPSSSASSDGNIGQAIFSSQESVASSSTSDEDHSAPATPLRPKAIKKQNKEENTAALLALLCLPTKGWTPKRGLVPVPYVPQPLYFVPPLVPDPIRVKKMRAEDEKRYLVRWFTPEKKGRDGFEGSWTPSWRRTQ